MLTTSCDKLAIHYHPKIAFVSIWSGLYIPTMFVMVESRQSPWMTLLLLWHLIVVVLRGLYFKLLNSAVLVLWFYTVSGGLSAVLLSAFVSLHPAVTAQGMTERCMPVFWESRIIFLCGAPGMDVDVERGYGDTFLQTGDRTLRCHFPWWWTEQPSHTAVRFVLVYDGFSVGELSKLQAI